MDTVALVGRLLISLAVVLGLMWLIARRFKRGAVRVKDGRLIDVLGRQQLSRSASVAVVRVLDRALVVGVTDSQVSVLGETDLAAVQARLTQGDSPRNKVKALRSVTAPAAARNTSAPAAAPAVPLRVRKPDAPTLPDVPDAPRGALAGSALSRETWRQTLESLRDLTARRG